MRTAVICEPVRTPIGRYGGMFGSLTAVDLGVAARSGTARADRRGSPGRRDVILGHCYPNSEAQAIGRWVALDAGLPVTVPGAGRPALWFGPAGRDQACLQSGFGRQRSGGRWRYRRA